MAGCTNHGCVVDPKKGVGTNGLCHCLDALGKEDARALRGRIHLMTETIRAQQEVIAAYRVGKSRLPESVHEVLDRARKAGLLR